MNTAQYTLISTAAEKKNTKRRQKNERFRRRLAREKRAENQALKLRIACWAAATIWLFVGLQCLLHA